MATTLKLLNGSTTDPLTVNYQTNFTYTIQASFSGLGDEPITNAYIEDFIPNYISYSLPTPDPTNYIQSISEEDATINGIDGKLITFNFGSLAGTGITSSFDMVCKYNLGTTNNTIFANKVDLSIYQGATVTTLNSQAPDVTLLVTGNYSLSKRKTFPPADPDPGCPVEYKLLLSNTGDKGSILDSIHIEDILPPEVTIDPTFTPIGRDVSPAPYNDTSWNTTGTVDYANNTVTFDLPKAPPASQAYYGTSYEITIKVIVDPTIVVDPNNPPRITNTANWSINGTDQTPVSLETPLSTAIYSASFSQSKYGPSSGPIEDTTTDPPLTINGEPISYELYINNTGNQDLSDVILEDFIPAEVDINRIFTGSYSITGSSTITITYSIDNGLTWKPLGTYGTVGSWVSINEPHITNLRWVFSNWSIGARHAIAPKIDGIINANAVSGGTIINNASLTYDTPTHTITRTTSKSTPLNSAPALSLSKGKAVAPSPVVPGSIIRYSIGIPQCTSQIINPIITDLLPPQVEYIGNVGLTYNNYFAANGGKNIPINYSLIKEENYQGTGRTMLTFSLYTVEPPAPTIIDQRSSINLQFDVKVKIGAIGTISNVANLNALDAARPISTSPVNDSISYNCSLASDKRVKGHLDSDYIEHPDVGKTLDCGCLMYKLIILNSGNLNLETLELVDILPHIGDTGVILTNDSRDSQFPVYLNGLISVSLVGITGTTQNVTIQYSESYDPIRFGETNQDIGTVDDWTTSPPLLSNIKSFKINISGVSIKPSESIEVYVPCIVPVGVDPNHIAWNSFAIRGTYFNNAGVLSSFLPVEPEKAGIQIQLPTYPGIIGHFTFHDINQDGIYEPEIDTGLNDVTVKLYNKATNELISTKITENDLNGNPGYYLFSDLPIFDANGDAIEYYLDFIPPSGYNCTFQNTSALGSKPSVNIATFGKTPAITLSNVLNNDYENMYAGALDRICKTVSINECLNINNKNLKIQSINTAQSFVTPTITRVHLDKSKLIYTKYESFPNPIPGYNLHINTNLISNINYNNNQNETFSTTHKIILFMPLHLSNVPFTEDANVDTVNFYIDGSGKGCFVTLKLEVCAKF